MSLSLIPDEFQSLLTSQFCQVAFLSAALTPRVNSSRVLSPFNFVVVCHFRFVSVQEIIITFSLVLLIHVSK